LQERFKIFPIRSLTTLMSLDIARSCDHHDFDSKQKKCRRIGERYPEGDLELYIPLEMVPL
jgi:hypothetical protein